MSSYSDNRMLSTSAFSFVAVFLAFSSAAPCQQESVPARAPIIQPGAPGKASRTLSPATLAAIPAPQATAADIDFMQGMVMHHGQAVEMTALIATRTQNPSVQSIGKKISISQIDEMKFMKRWLEARGHDASSHGMSGMKMGDGSTMSMALMPGMLTTPQMVALRKSSGAEFDRLFLTGMIQHHTGALTMVDDLFGTAGAGQDADLFDFATDVDNTQRAEIRIMQDLLKER